MSLLATPVKFQAPSLSLPTALDVGRVTFALFSKIEWGLCGLLILAALSSPGIRSARVIAAVVLAAILAAQAMWLLPILDARVLQIIAGQRVAPSNHHLFYIAAELLKTLLLLAVCLDALRALISREEHARCA